MGINNRFSNRINNNGAKMKIKQGSKIATFLQWIVIKCMGLVYPIKSGVDNNDAKVICAYRNLEGNVVGFVFFNSEAERESWVEETTPRCIYTKGV
jgi:hypothetical protein